MFKATQSPSLKEFNYLQCGLHGFSFRDRLLKIFISGMSLSSRVALSFMIVACLYANANLAGSLWRYT